MNCILLDQSDFTGAAQVRLEGRRHKHIAGVLKAAVGDRLMVGLTGGRLGAGIVRSIDAGSCVLDVTLDRDPPPALPLTLIVALPRPKSMRKVVHAAVTLGVKRLFFAGTWRVDKSYWQTPWLAEAYLRGLETLGLEQAVDTIMPVIGLRRRFKPFVEDELPAIAAGTRALVAHPGAAAPCPWRLEGRLTLAVGPEGGFTDYEIEKLAACGFEPVSFGPRVLRVEEAVPALIGRLWAGGG